MSGDDFEFDDDIAGLEAELAEERQRAIAMDHLIFQTIAYVERKHPGLLDDIEASLPRLFDDADDHTGDDEAVRDIARAYIAGLRQRR